MKASVWMVIMTVFGFAVMAPTAIAQTIRTGPIRIEPPKASRTAPVPDVEILRPAREETPDRPARSGPRDEFGPLRSLATIYCAAANVKVTNLAYQFSCYRRGYGDSLVEYGEGEVFVIRRDNTQPSWALGPEEFEWIFENIWQRSFQSKGPVRKTQYFDRRFLYLPERPAPAKYCANVALPDMGETSEPDPKCHDIASVEFHIVEE
jgi:hypothetical protein